MLRLSERRERRADDVPVDRGCLLVNGDLYLGYLTGMSDVMTNQPKDAWRKRTNLLHECQRCLATMFADQVVEEPCHANTWTYTGEHRYERHTL